MDLSVIQRLVEELDEQLRGRRIDQVYALPKNDVVIVAGRRSGPRLWFSAEPDDPHLYMRPGPHPTPRRPPGFAMAARNALVGRRVAAVSLVGSDRVVELKCSGDGVRVVFELIPRRATAMIVDEDDAVIAVWQPRRGRPGLSDTYEPPGGAARPQVGAVEDDVWERLDASADDDDLVRGLMRSISGMSLLIAREIAHGGVAGGPEAGDPAATESTTGEAAATGSIAGEPATGGSTTRSSLRESALREIERSAAQTTSARIYAPVPLDRLEAPPPPRAFFVAPYELNHAVDRVRQGTLVEEPFPTLIDALATYYPLRASLIALEAARSSLVNALEIGIARTERTLDAVAEDAGGAGDAEQHRTWADLLLAYPHAERTGAIANVPDPWSADGATLEIPLDPARSLVDNAQAYYNRARRAERSAARTAARRRRLRERATDLRKLAEEARLAGDPGACKRLVRAAAEHGVVVKTDRWAVPEAAGSAAEHHGDEADSGPATEVRATRTARSLPGIDRYVSSDGSEILVGRNARANERLTHRLASPHDFWLHAEGPGSHVVVRNPNREDAPSEVALREAASLAAHFSSARGATKVNVRWTQARHVRKPRGGPTGQVVLKAAQTYLAEPLEPEVLFACPDDGTDSAR